MDSKDVEIVNNAFDTNDAVTDEFLKTGSIRYKSVGINYFKRCIHDCKTYDYGWTKYEIRRSIKEEEDSIEKLKASPVKYVYYEMCIRPAEPSDLDWAFTDLKHLKVKRRKQLKEAVNSNFTDFEQGALKTALTRVPKTQKKFYSRLMTRLGIE